MARTNVVSSFLHISPPVTCDTFQLVIWMCHNNVANCNNIFMSILSGLMPQKNISPSFVSFTSPRLNIEIIFHDTHEYCMRWVFHVICFLLLAQQPIEFQSGSISNNHARKNIRAKRSQDNEIYSLWRHSSFNFASFYLCLLSLFLLNEVLNTLF